MTIQSHDWTGTPPHFSFSLKGEISMYRSWVELADKEKYLKLNGQGELVIDFPGPLQVIDFHTHLCSTIIPKKGDPERKGAPLSYPTLPPLEKLDLDTPYWTAGEPFKMKGLSAVTGFSSLGLKILNAMLKGGTYENCFRVQDENLIAKSVLLPLSTRKNDLSRQALAAAENHPQRFIPFCSVHPLAVDAARKVKINKEGGAKGLKLKITDLEMKGDFEPLVSLFQSCYDANLPVLLHTGAISSLDREAMSPLMWKLTQSTRVELFGELLKRLPDDFTFIFGHGGIQQYRLVAEYMKRHPAACAELSTQSAGSIRYLMREVGAERLLFGSDWPALPQALTLSRVLLATEEDPKARELILYRNAARILGL